MKKFNKTKAIATAASVIAIAWLLPAPAMAETHTYDKDVAEYTHLLGDKISTTEMKKRLERYSEESNIPKEELVKSEISQVENPNSAQITASSGGIGNKKLTPSQPGDYFYTPFLGIVGHTGIYWKKDRIVEAPGPGYTAHWVALDDAKIQSGTVIMRVRTTTEKRKKAADRSYTYVGRGYNLAYLNGNKDDKGGMHCAQLVWASYKYGANIDLDTTGGDNIVWPTDLRNSSKAYVIKTIK